MAGKRARQSNHRNHKRILEALRNGDYEALMPFGAKHFLPPLDPETGQSSERRGLDLKTFNSWVEGRTPSRNERRG